MRQQGVRSLSLDLKVPAELRGQELTATQMAACDATLAEYRIIFKEKFPIDAQRTLGRRRSTKLRPAIGVMLVSQELMPQYLGCLHLPTPGVVLVVTDEMRERATELATPCLA